MENEKKMGNRNLVNYKDNNKRFWKKTAKIYEKFVTRGKKAEQAYVEMEGAIQEQLHPDMCVLELAAGPGLLSAKIAEVCKTLEVTDFAEEMLEQAKKQGLPENTTFAVADATNLQYGEGTFDAIVIANALHIMPDPVSAMQEIKRVLRTEGILIAPTFTRESMHSNLVERLMEAVGFKTFSRWTHGSFQQFLEEQGMQVVKEKVITGHNFPISFVVCKKKR